MSDDYHGGKKVYSQQIQSAQGINLEKLLRISNVSEFNGEVIYESWSEWNFQ